MKVGPAINIHAATLHSLEDFFTLFSFYSLIFIRIVVTVLLLLKIFRYRNFFTHINFVKLSIYSGGGGKDFTLTALVGKQESIN